MPLRIDKPSAPPRFGHWLSRQRKARDLTQEDLAERLGCSVWSIQKIEVGNRRPSKQVAEILAAYFDIPDAQRAAFLQFARGQAGDWQNSPAGQTTTPGVWPQHDVGSDADPHALARPNNLTTQLTSFVGRAVELPRACDLILTAEVRLLTLTGPPGTGKTRLALQAAAELLRYPEFRGWGVLRQPGSYQLPWPGNIRYRPGPGRKRGPESVTAGGHEGVSQG